MSQLTFDFDLETTHWAPIYKPFNGSLVDYIGDDLCRDCGAKTAYNQGGAGRSGIYAICDGCAQLDNCRLRTCRPVIERREASGFAVEEVAHCQDCSWFVIDRTGWDDAFEVDDLVAEHARPRHVSHWGMTHFMEEHDGLVAAREKRRAAYLRRQETARGDQAEGRQHGHVRG